VDNNNKSKLVLFPDDTSLIITRQNPITFMKDKNRAFTTIDNNWFKANLLSLNFEKTNLTLSLPMTTIVAPQLNVIKWQMGFNSAG
jgi:hypothetical protein